MKNDRIRVGLIGANPDRGWAMGVHVPALQALAGADGIRLQRRPALCPCGGGHPRRHIARAGFRACAQAAHSARCHPARVGYGAAADAVIVRKRGGFSTCVLRGPAPHPEVRAACASQEGWAPQDGAEARAFVRCASRAGRNMPAIRLTLPGVGYVRQSRCKVQGSASSLALAAPHRLGRA
jgi:hypothetical protein